MKLEKHIRGAIFDLDGTLLNSMHVWQDVDAKFFCRRGLAMPQDYPHIVKAMELSEAAAYTKAAFSLPESEEELIREWRDMVKEEYARNVCLKPYAKETLLRLKSMGIELAVATSSSRELYLPALVRCGVSELFSAFAETGEGARGKAHPDVYLLAAKRLGLPPQACAVFEDVAVGVDSAKRGGFFTVAVADPLSACDEAALRARADVYLTSFFELFS